MLIVIGKANSRAIVTLLNNAGLLFLVSYSLTLAPSVSFLFHLLVITALLWSITLVYGENEGFRAPII